MKFGVVRFTLRPAQVDWEFLGDRRVGRRPRPRYLPLAPRSRLYLRDQLSDD